MGEDDVFVDSTVFGVYSLEGFAAMDRGNSPSKVYHACLETKVQEQVFELFGQVRLEAVSQEGFRSFLNGLLCKLRKDY